MQLKNPKTNQPTKNTKPSNSSYPRENFPNQKLCPGLCHTYICLQFKAPVIPNHWKYFFRLMGIPFLRNQLGEYRCKELARLNVSVLQLHATVT